ncbi:MAG: ABC transporter permease [Tissierellaceae bacterium]|nr:ABC transporter permease [Tissierellaceae bacterium]
MRLFQLVFVNIKRMIKDPSKFGFMFIMPIAVIFLVSFMDGGSSSSSAMSNVDIAINIEDTGDLGAEVFNSTTKSNWIFNNQRDTALELLEKSQVAIVYNVPENFTEKIDNYEKPIIESFKREEGNATIALEIEINDKINELIKKRFLLDNKVITEVDELYTLKTETVFERNKKVSNGDLHTVTMLLIYFIILGSTTIGAELIEFKKKNIISRAITTPNKDSTILGSIALSLLLFQVGANLIVLFLGQRFIGYNIVNFHIITVNLILASMFSITLSLAMSRIFTNEGTGSLITALVSMLTLFLSMFAQEGIYQSVPLFIKNLGKFTPQYWIFDSLEKTIFFPNTLIVLLMVLALFSAGSYRIKDFIRK